jgi:uncharacterized protein
MTDISYLIEEMQESSFYPHPVTQPIKIIQTHASLVFLTGEYAYKIKKQVYLEFLDYSTLAKRKHFLEIELKLNKKIAPELYLAVIPIINQNNNLTLGGTGEVVEYTLQMRQFPQKNLFTNLLAANKLSSDRAVYPKGNRLIELGKIVAQFHQTADTNEYISSFGTVAKIRVAIAQNYQQSQKYLGVVQTQTQLDKTKAYTDYFLSEREDLFNNRIKQHKIKECHGDLHLNNICLWQNKIQLFDRIEFNESFRFVDTFYDIAFTIMDLDTRSRPDLANVFLNSYLEYTGDWTGLLLLPFYLSRQAYVRGKVNSFLLDDPEVSVASKEQAKKTASNYYRQAYQYTQTKSGSLILMSGLSGSGKSTVAHYLAKQQGAIHLRSDAVRKHLAGIPVDESGQDDLYSAEMTQKTYTRLLELGLLLAKEGFTVILDAKYDRLAQRQTAITQGNSQSIPIKIIQCNAPVSILRDRINKRQGDISDATADLITSQQANAEAITAAEKVYVTTVDTSLANWQEQLTNATH